MERISSHVEDGLSSSQDGAKKRRRNGNATHLGGKRANTGIKNNLRRLQPPPGNGKTDGVASAAKKNTWNEICDDEKSCNPIEQEKASSLASV